MPNFFTHNRHNAIYENDVTVEKVVILFVDFFFTLETNKEREYQKLLHGVPLSKYRERIERVIKRASCVQPAGAVISLFVIFILLLAFILLSLTHSIAL